MHRILSLAVLLALLPFLTGATIIVRGPVRPAAGGASPPYEDLFNRADQNPIAGDWESGLGGNGQVKILSNSAQGVSGMGIASVKTSALTINSDQRAIVDIDSGFEDDKQGAVIRLQSSGACYRVWWNFTFGVGNISYRDASGTETEIGSRWSGYPTSDDRLGVEMTGSSIRPFTISKATSTKTYLKAAETDSTLTGGQPGVWVNGGQIVKFRAENY